MEIRAVNPIDSICGEEDYACRLLSISTHISHKALINMEFDKLLQLTVGLIAKVMDVSHVKIVQKVEDSSFTLLFRATCGWSMDLCGKVFNPGAEPHAAFTLKSLEPVVVPDSDEETRFTPPTLYKQEGLKSGVAVVIYGQKTIFGVLEVDHLEKRKYTDQEIVFLKSIANSLGLAYENQRLMEMMYSANWELEQFALVASHDLQAPLRKINQMLGMLERRIEHQLDTEDQHLIGRIQKSSQTLQELVQDVLSYSRAPRQQPKLNLFPLDTLLGEIIADKALEIEEKKAVITIEDPIRVIADYQQLRQLFQNLIENSLTFHKADEPPVITIRSEMLERSCKIEVTDNGIGFDEGMVERMFKPFQSLHGSVYKGTGMGLAICKKIVENHHGTIAAFGHPGRGATFVIELPFREADDNEKP